MCRSYSRHVGGSLVKCVYEAWMQVRNFFAVILRRCSHCPLSRGFPHQNCVQMVFLTVPDPSNVCTSVPDDSTSATYMPYAHLLPKCLSGWLLIHVPHACDARLALFYSGFCLANSVTSAHGEMLKPCLVTRILGGKEAFIIGNPWDLPVFTEITSS